MNTAAAACFHLNRDEAIGQPLWTVLPQLVGTEFERRYRIAMDTRRADEFIAPAAVNRGLYIEIRVQPFQDGLGVTFRDISEQRRRELSSEALAAHLRLALKAGRMAAWEYDPKSETLGASPELNALIGLPPDAVLDLNELRERFYPGDRERLRIAAAAARAAGQGYFEAEFRLFATGGELRWLWMRAEIGPGEGGQPERTLGVVLDITERKRMEEQLKAREADLEAALEAGRLAFIDFDHRTQVFKPSPRLNELYGYERSYAITLGDVRSRYHPDDAPKVAEWLERYRDDPSLRDWRWTFRILLPDGETRWLEGLGAYDRAEDGTILRSRGVLMDITEQKRWEEHQRLLINELNHRVKNTLAIVQGLAKQSFRPELSVAVSLPRFEARLAALAAAHTLLTKRSWKSASIRHVIREAVEATTALFGDKVFTDRPDIAISPQLTIGLSLALHELSTNAIKHGALLVGSGRVRLSWTVEAEMLKLVWSESGGPPAIRPERAGFGTRLLERGLARELSGRVELDFAADGLKCLIEAPLPRSSEALDGDSPEIHR